MQVVNLLAMMAFAGKAPIYFTYSRYKVRRGSSLARFYLYSITMLLARSPSKKLLLSARSFIRPVPSSQTAAVSAGFHLTWSKAALLTRTAQTVCAILLATAVTTTLKWRRCSNRAIQLLGELRPTMALAPIDEQGAPVTVTLIGDAKSLRPAAPT